MVPTTLESRAEDIFREMGGLSSAYAYFTDNEIIDICLFNGFTEILFPYYVEFNGALSSGLYDYVSLDLTSLNYEPNSYVCLTDKYYRPLYSTIINKQTIDGKASYYLGKSPEDKEFLSSCADGQLLFMVYKSKNSVSLAQIIVSHKLPFSVLDLNRLNWEAGQKKVTSELSVSGELVINNPNNMELTLFRLESPLKSYPNEAEIVHGAYTIAYKSSLSSLYTKYLKDSWICIREYSFYAEPDIEEINDQAELKSLLESRGYTVAIETNLGYVMNKVEGGETLEVSVIVEENNIIDTVESSKFKSLVLVDLSGTNTDYITLLDNTAHLSIKSSHVYGNITTEPKLVSKSAFKVSADLNYA